MFSVFNLKWKIMALNTAMVLVRRAVLQIIYVDKDAMQ